MSVTVSDGQVSVSEEFILNVVQINDSPVLDLIGSQSINEDNIFTYTLSANDVDGDALTYFETIVSGDATGDIIDNILTVTPAPNFFGEVQVSVAVTDGVDSDNEIFILDVLSVNDAPTIIVTLEDLDVDEDSNAITIDLSTVFDDVDSEELFYSAEENLSSAQLLSLIHI